MNTTKTTITLSEMQAMKRELESQGFRLQYSVLSDDRSQSGIFYAHPDGRRAGLRNCRIEYYSAATEGGAA